MVLEHILWFCFKQHVIYFDATVQVAELRNVAFNLSSSPSCVVIEQEGLGRYSNVMTNFICHSLSMWFDKLTSLCETRDFMNR